jgi:hypothetical protein
MPLRSYFPGCLTDLCWLVFMSGYKLDLNQLPPEFDLDLIDLEAANPAFFTQSEPIVAIWGSSDQLKVSSAGDKLDVAHVHAQLGAISTPGDNQYVAPVALSAKEKGLHGIVEGDEDPDDIVEVVWCTLSVPHTGQTFGTKEEVKS